MSRIKLLLDVIEDVRSLAESLQAVADAMTEPEECATAAAEEAAPKAEAAAKPKQEEPKTLTLEEVRPVLSAKSRKGHTAEIKQLLLKHGADKLSGIDPKEYPALLAEAEAL